MINKCNNVKPMRKMIHATCQRCNSEISITSPEQIGLNVGRDRILCKGCYEWEMIPASF